MRLRPPQLSRGPRAALLTVLALVLVVGGYILGWRVAPENTVETSIGRVAFEVSPSLHGDATAVIPVADWGFRVDAFDAPFELRAELRSLDRSALTRAADGDLSVLRTTEDELRSGAQSAIVRGFAWGIGGALAALLVMTLIWRGLRPWWGLLAIGVGVCVLVTGGALVAARATFDATAFQSPTYFANGAELRRILEVAENERVESGYGSNFGSILRSISSVLASAPTTSAPGRDFYLGSDLHANALVVQPLSEAIGNDPLLLAGDFGQRGEAAEARALAPRVAALGKRVIATSGNHDTSSLMEALRDEGVRTLGDGISREPGVVEVDGVRIAGFPDPLEWTGLGDPDERPITFSDLPDAEAAFDDALDELQAGFEALDPAPAMIMIHQNGLAQALAERLHESEYQRNLVIATGHDHLQHIDRYGKIVVVDAGSIGAGGVFDAGSASIGLAELHFDPNLSQLRSVDLISIEPFSGQAQASRVVMDTLCPEAERCTFEPPGHDASVLDRTEADDGPPSN